MPRYEKKINNNDNNNNNIIIIIIIIIAPKDNIYSVVIMAEPLRGSLGSRDECRTAPDGR